LSIAIAGTLPRSLKDSLGPPLQLAVERSSAVSLSSSPVSRQAVSDADASRAVNRYRVAIIRILLGPR